ncbi:complex I subunit 4 family protein [Mucilaginibacter flavus]|uniref:complex I subunit 4 family protein n=1 Tax=Mucilaginibacter flavus TaxID=931504 RepID=UPI0025B498C6|nr:NADH-quinone oxidoreductase subunit M [Mucilaginibacter flavus]MDN3580200.1 NADH-quinone oxidoreductase subunit M [Mucilaginibacter flavus]
MTVSILIFLPVIAAVIVAFLKNSAARYAALFFSIAELAIAGLFLSKFVPDATTQFGIDVPWIAKFGIYFSAGIDGISMIMVLLTTILVPLIILSTFNHEYKNSGAFYALILFMQAGMLVVFTALDGFLFYVGWEAALIPIYFICALWGGENRIRITLKFFIYTFAGSLFMLVALIYLYLQSPDKTFSIHTFYALKLTAPQQSWVFLAFFLAFAIKMPVFPFHTWQPDTYTEAPTGGTMMLSGIMLKMGVYGVIRWLIPNAPLGLVHWQTLITILAVIGIVYASIIAFNQKDGKRLVAYSSIAHVGLIAAGIFVWNIQGLQGALVQMLSHGINVIGMFFIWDIISRRLGTRDISQLGGIAKVAPKFAIAFLIIVLGTVGLPLTNGFVGEFLLIGSMFNYSAAHYQNLTIVIFAGSTIILGAVYMLRMYKNVMQGEVNELTAKFTDITGSEQLVLGIICALIIVIGVYPQPILHISEAAVTNLMNTLNGKLVF